MAQQEENVLEGPGAVEGPVLKFPESKATEIHKDNSCVCRLNVVGETVCSFF